MTYVLNMTYILINIKKSLQVIYEYLSKSSFTNKK